MPFLTFFQIIVCSTPAHLETAAFRRSFCVTETCVNWYFSLSFTSHRMTFSSLWVGATVVAFFQFCRNQSVALSCNWDINKLQTQVDCFFLSFESSTFQRNESIQFNWKWFLRVNWKHSSVNAIQSFFVLFFSSDKFDMKLSFHRCRFARYHFYWIENKFSSNFLVSEFAFSAVSDKSVNTFNGPNREVTRLKMHLFFFSFVFSVFGSLCSRFCDATKRRRFQTWALVQSKKKNK